MNGSLRPKILLFCCLVIAGVSPCLAQITYDRLVPVYDCRLTPLSTWCFSIDSATPITVGKNIAGLGTTYHFCLSYDSSAGATRPIRIILALDQSGSMCMDGNTNGNTMCAGIALNDPTDKRIEASKSFVDVLKSEQPTSEIGVVRFSELTNLDGYLAPLPLTDANVALIKAEIDKASCAAKGLPKKKATESRENTNVGLALDTALSLVDLNYQAISKTMDRHIVILTDGEWGDTNLLPATLIAQYQTKFPGRPVPKIDAVFISDSAWHVAHGFPPAGAVSCCTGPDCRPGDTTLVDLKYLQSATQLSGGVYIPGTTPATIVQKMQDLLSKITTTTPIDLKAISFINKKTNQIFKGSIAKPDSTVNNYTVTTPLLPLDFGANTYAVAETLGAKAGNVARTFTFTIIRSTTDSASPGLSNLFSTTCGEDTIGLSMVGDPAVQTAQSLIKTTGSVEPQNATLFAPEDIFVRAFTSFPDADASGLTLALYHLDHSVKDASGHNANGTGSPGYTASTSDGAFGFCMNGGTFSMPIPDLSGNFTLEFWAKPAAGATAIDFMTGAPFTLGIDASSHLTFKTPTDTLISPFRVDRNVWELIAVVRVGGIINLYINGLQITANNKPAAGPISSGAETVLAGSGTFIDEIRISGARRQVDVSGVFMLDIPTASNITWTFNGANTAGAVGTLPASAWSASGNGSAAISLTSKQGQYLIVNFLHIPKLHDLVWSKNSNPVFFRANGENIAKPATAPNPFNPLNAPIPDKIRETIGIKGTPADITSGSVTMFKVPKQMPTDSISGTWSLFDALGNTLVKNRNLLMEQISIS
ncbi:MAG: hypothetical protein PHC61_13965, partial [Chitinivibrionales bacterium]|nr:hypothetical protein [Chitinivibrionales bacterium]